MDFPQSLPIKEKYLCPACSNHIALEYLRSKQIISCPTCTASLSSNFESSFKIGLLIGFFIWLLSILIIWLAHEFVERYKLVFYLFWPIASFYVGYIAFCCMFKIKKNP
ncbi:hypothetical protein EV696_12837 [Permianibacter aggregans]|uniref:Uncharacterized protein n=1 Tax=Permianibacter aggregans TaxID=1510150 RepID=A0A4V3D6E4_9GAMM|nr:hypothetical protein EV696_12837 [Permianibacter aggregans]